MRSALIGMLAAATALAGCATATAPMPVGVVRSNMPIIDTGPPPGMAYLYGSAEADALSEQAYNGMLGYVRALLDRARDARGRLPHQRAGGTLPRWPATASAVLAAGSTAAMPQPVSCGALPPAVVLDMDETTVLNLGYEYNDAQTGQPYDAKRWDAWERGGVDKLVAVPGAVAAFRQLRAMSVTVVINTNRSAANAADTARALADAGLGMFEHGTTLWLKGDVDGKSGKDGRRQAIAAHYCVLAQMGDQLGDFADFFNPPGPAPASGRRLLPSTSRLVARWGAGWFILPNPVYGTGLGSGWDDTFPAARRWTTQSAPEPQGVK